MRKVNRPERILIDTGYWIALFNERDGYHDDAQKLLEIINETNLILPWPTLYETINTRLSKNKNGINQFDKLLLQPNIYLLDDTHYKEKALQISLQSSTSNNRPISLVDCIIREILADVNININYLLTFNNCDFIDLCQKRKIDILN